MKHTILATLARLAVYLLIILFFTQTYNAWYNCGSYSSADCAVQKVAYYGVLFGCWMLIFEVVFRLALYIRRNPRVKRVFFAVVGSYMIVQTVVWLFVSIQHPERRFMLLLSGFFVWGGYALIKKAKNIQQPIAITDAPTAELAVPNEPMRRLFTSLTSNAGLILLATLAIGVWTSNLHSLYRQASKPALTVEAQTWPEAQTWVELGRQIKLHYPGKYDDLYDENVGLAVKATGATAICNDNTTSYSKTRSGTCSYHKGVKIWLTRPTDP